MRNLVALIAVVSGLLAYRTDTRAVIRWILRTVPKGEVDDIQLA